MPFDDNAPKPRMEGGWFRWDQPLASVKPEWVDGNAHLNMGYYMVAFDLQTDRVWTPLGLGNALRRIDMGTFAAEAWLDYQREMTEGMPIGCDSMVVSFDEKRLLMKHRMFHFTEGWVSSENELLYLCVDMTTRRVGKWPQHVLDGFAKVATGEPTRRVTLRKRGT